MKDQRGLGVGDRIMTAVETEARKHGAKELVLEAQIEAEGFYAKRGYLPEGPIFLDCGIDHRKMRLKL